MAACSGRHDHTHELLPRSAGGSITDPDNCIGVCARCHRFIHDNPREAMARGLLRSRYDMTNAIQQTEQDIFDVRRRRYASEFAEAKRQAEAHGWELKQIAGAHNEQGARYDLIITPQIGLTLMAGSGILDAWDLSAATCDALVEKIGPPPVRSLTELIAGLAAIGPLVGRKQSTPNHVMEPQARAAG